MEDKEISHQDLFGQDLQPGHFVVAATSYSLDVYRVKHLTEKMVRIISIHAKTRQALKGNLRYSKDLLRIDDTLVTFYLMKKK